MKKHIDQNPRERALKHGIHSLKTSELLALILRTGNRKQNVLELAEQIMSKYRLAELKELDHVNLCQEDGIGVAKALAILACFELSKRCEVSNQNAIFIKNASDCYNLLKGYPYNFDQEEFYCIYLNTRRRLLKIKKLFVGTVEFSIVHPREIFKYAFEYSASYIILAHNHPSAIVTPSIEDIKITKKLVECGIIFNIKVIDHLVYSESTYFSMLEEQLLIF